MSRLPIILLVLFPCLLWAQPPLESLETLNPSLKALLLEGRVAEEKQDYLNAERAYLSAWEKGKNDPVVFDHLTFLYRTTYQLDKLDALDKAPTLTERILERNFPDSIPVLSPSEYTLADFPQQEDEKNLNLIRANPQHADAFFALGEKLFPYAGWEAEAAVYLKKTIELRPNRWEARRLLAHLFQRTGEYGKAEVQLQRLLESGLETHRARRDLISLYHQWGRKGALEKALRETLEDFPSDQHSLNVLGMLLEEQGRYVEAERLYHQYFPHAQDPERGVWMLLNHYQRCLESYPDSLQFHRAAGELYYYLVFPELSFFSEITLSGKTTVTQNYWARRGIEHLRLVLDRRPDYPGAPSLHFQIGRLHQFRMEMEKSIAPLETALRGLPEKTDALLSLIDAYYQTKQYQLAKDSLESLQEQLELDYTHDLMLAELHALSGEYAPGLSLIEKIIGYYTPGQIPAQAFRIRAFMLDRQGKEAEAVEALQETIKNDYANYGDYYHIGKLILRQAKDDNAPITLEKEGQQKTWPSRVAYGMTWIDGALAKGLPKALLVSDPELQYLQESAEWQEVLSFY